MPLLFSCIFGFLALFPQAAFGWGLSLELNASWAEARLVFPALKNGEIKYCVETQSDRFREDSLALQTESALRLWLKALALQTLNKISITRVNCALGDFNLKVEAGPETEWTNLGTYQLSQTGGHYYSLVKIDSNYTYAKDARRYSIEDFLQFSQNLESEREGLEFVSFRQPSSVSDFSAAQKLDYLTVFFSTYPALIHEIGHSFGLCDTYDADLKDFCDPAYSSASQPTSVMRDASYFYLTADDVSGIRALFDRYKKR